MVTLILVAVTLGIQVGIGILLLLIHIRLKRLEVVRREQLAQTVKARVPYDERLKAEYARRGLKWEAPARPNG